MPGQACLDAPGVLHHIMGRGIEQGSISRDNRDRDNVLHRLADLASADAWTIYAWVLIPNHFHLLCISRCMDLAVRDVDELVNLIIGEYL